MEELVLIEGASSTSQANNPAGVDCWEILVVLQRLLAAAQPERYAAQFIGWGSS